ncbi:hypothetical protein [Algivirga pacifica]|uniref:Glutamate--cysteine ligase n=1 Tax=Algivirga pacifica TaxID=1162670 RepID=A0ABP9DF66_9BACT
MIAEKNAQKIDKLDSLLSVSADPMMPAIGLEAEFTLYLNDKATTPEKVFGDPTKLLEHLAMHRVGSSYHIPTGGAVYFDSGAIEVVTPIIEIEKGCAVKAGRSLWESIGFLRKELDHWEMKTGNKARLEGFSTHYNISFERPEDLNGQTRSVEKLALLLSYILPIPVMLLGANRKSTGIGVRPRGNRIEITADFTPSPALMIATMSLINSIVRKVMTWPSYELDMLDKKKIPYIPNFKPIKHTSRQGWLAKNSCFKVNPFECDINEKLWEVTQFDHKVSLRDIALAIKEKFYVAIARLADPFTFRLMLSVFRGDSPSMLDLDERPEAYEDVGKLCTWKNIFKGSEVAKSKYERVLINAILKRKLTIDGNEYLPIGMKGWTEVILERKNSHLRKVLSMDALIPLLDKWEEAAIK